jgi:hypothetical protein
MNKQQFKETYGQTVEKYTEQLLLIKQKAIEGNSLTFGICYNLNDYLELSDSSQYDRDAYYFVSEFATTWDKHSGDDLEFPIPDSRNITGPEYWKGDQLEYRLDLIDYLIDRLNQIQ